MAEQSFSGKWIAPGVHETTWANLTSGNTAAPQSGTYLGNRTIFITGNLVDTNTLSILGSNAPTVTGTFFALTDPNGNTLVFTETGTEEILENTRWIKPDWTNLVDGNDFTVILLQSGKKL